MTIEIDGAGILAALAHDPEAFSMTKAQVDALAEYAVVSKLKEKALSLESLRKLASALDSQDFQKLVGNLSDKDAKAIAKLDGKHPDYKDANGNWHRSQIIRLGKCDIDPTVANRPARPPKSSAPKAPRSNKPKIGAIMGSEALAAGAEQKKHGGSKRSKPAEK